MSDIVTAVQRGSQVYVYGAGQRQLCSVYAGTGPNDGLCKVDDLAGHRLGEIIAFREGLHRVFFR